MGDDFKVNQIGLDNGDAEIVSDLDENGEKIDPKQFVKNQRAKK